MKKTLRYILGEKERTAEQAHKLIDYLHKRKQKVVWTASPITLNTRKTQPYPLGAYEKETEVRDLPVRDVNDNQGMVAVKGVHDYIDKIARGDTIEPVEVTKNTKTYRDTWDNLNGHHRVLATKALGKKMIKASIREK